MSKEQIGNFAGSIAILSALLLVETEHEIECMEGHVHREIDVLHVTYDCSKYGFLCVIFFAVIDGYYRICVAVETFLTVFMATFFFAVVFFFIHVVLKQMLHFTVPEKMKGCADTPGVLFFLSDMLAVLATVVYSSVVIWKYKKAAEICRLKTIYEKKGKEPRRKN